MTQWAKLPDLTCLCNSNEFVYKLQSDRMNFILFLQFFFLNNDACNSDKKWQWSIWSYRKWTCNKHVMRGDEYTQYWATCWNTRNLTPTLPQWFCINVWLTDAQKIFLANIPAIAKIPDLTLLHNNTINTTIHDIRLSVCSDVCRINFWVVRTLKLITFHPFINGIMVILVHFLDFDCSRFLSDWLFFWGGEVSASGKRARINNNDQRKVLHIFEQLRCNLQWWEVGWYTMYATIM